MKTKEINSVDRITLTQQNIEDVNKIRNILNSERVVEYSLSESQQQLIENWYRNLIIDNPSINDVYIPPNGRVLIDEIDRFKRFLLDKVFIDQQGKSLIEQLATLSKDNSLIAIKIFGFNSQPDRIFSYLVDGAMNDIMRVHDSQDVSENHKHILLIRDSLITETMVT